MLEVSVSPHPGMGMLVDSTSMRGAALHSLHAAPLSTSASARRISLQRTKLHRNWWRISSTRADYHASEWRRQSRELRCEIEELRAALLAADVVAKQDERNQHLELVKLVSAIADILSHEHRPAEEVGNFMPNAVENVVRNGGQHALSEAPGRELSVPNFVFGREEEEASNKIAMLELEGAHKQDNNVNKISELGSEDLRVKEEGLSTLRRLKHLNVHEYVHSALQVSHLRSWIQRRGIAE